MTNILLIAGEVSGDCAASFINDTIFNLCEKKQKDNISLFAVGGDCLKEKGVFIIDNIISYSTVGFIESIIPAIRLISRVKGIIKYIKSSPINLIILVDNQGTNLVIARFAKKLNIPVVYYFPPAVSLWGKWNIKKLKKRVDLILCPFYKDYLLYKKAKANAIYVGHYLTKLIKSDSITFTEKPANNKTIIGLFPGSRIKEVKNLLPYLLKTALAIKKDALFIIPIATKELESIIKTKTKPYEKHLNIKYTKISCTNKDHLKCNIAIAASGTVSLELALYNVPMLIVYKVSSITYLIAKMLLKEKYICLVNILLNENVVPEIILKRKESLQKLIRQANKLLSSAKLQKMQKEKLKQIRTHLHKENGDKIIYNALSKYFQP